MAPYLVLRIILSDRYEQVRFVDVKNKAQKKKKREKEKNKNTTGIE